MSRRLSFIDTWRFVAVALVILYHLKSHDPRIADALARAHLRAIGEYGWLGVFIFFFISGFVVSRSCLDEKAARGTFSSGGFYIRRLYRILPPLAFYLLGCSALGLMGMIDFSPRSILGALYLCNTRFSFIDCGWYVGHTWSLAFEEQFYLGFPLVFSLIELGQKRWLGLAVAAPFVILPFLFDAHWIGKGGFVLVYGLFLAGYIAAKHDELLSAVHGKAWVAIAGMGAAAIVFSVPSSTPNLFYVPTIPVMVLASGAIGGFLTRLFSTPLISYLGRASYSMYLWQELFTGGLLSRVPLWTEVLAIAAMIAACLALFAFVERPLIRLGRARSTALVEKDRSVASGWGSRAGRSSLQ